MNNLYIPKFLEPIIVLHEPQSMNTILLHTRVMITNLDNVMNIISCSGKIHGFMATMHMPAVHIVVHTEKKI